MKKVAAIVALSALATTQAAHAIITGTANAAIQIAPPPVANFPALIGPNGFAWNEQQNVLVSGVFCDMTVNPSNSILPTPGIVTGPVDSHFIHICDLSGVPTLGDVFFATPIIGVMFNDFTLDNSDFLGAGGTSYPTLQPGRGMGQGVIQINGNHLRFDIPAVAGAADITQIRVLTHAVPAPGSLALAGLGGVALLRRRRGGVS